MFDVDENRGAPTWNRRYAQVRVVGRPARRGRARHWAVAQMVAGRDRDAGRASGVRVRRESASPRFATLTWWTCRCSAARLGCGGASNAGVDRRAGQRGPSRTRRSWWAVGRSRHARRGGRPSRSAGTVAGLQGELDAVLREAGVVAVACVLIAVVVDQPGVVAARLDRVGRNSGSPHSGGQRGRRQGGGRALPTSGVPRRTGVAGWWCRSAEAGRCRAT